MGAQTVLDEAGTGGTAAADRSCAILDGAARSVAGDAVELAAVDSDGRCVALVQGRLLYQLRLDRERAADHYCVDREVIPDPDRVRPHTVAGRVGCVVRGGLQSFPAFHGDAGRPGTMVLSVSWEVRGDPGAPVDRARLAEMTDRITEHVITHHLR